MLWLKLVDNIKTPFTTHDFVVGTDLFDACTHFHADHCSFTAITHCINVLILTFAIGDSSLTEIVRGQLDRHAVTRYDANKMFPHLPCNMSYNLVAVFKFYSKLSTRKGLYDCSGQFDYFFTRRHKYNKS
jgi:hypothetical protein